MPDSIQTRTRPRDSEVIAALHGVRKQYGAVTALDDTSLQVRRGEVFALLGPNGAGKSTAISLLLGLQGPDSGRAELFGTAPQQIESRQRIGVMLQSAALPDTLKVRELLQLTAGYYPAPRPLAETVQLAGVSGLLERRYAKLSGGQQRSVQFALALCGNPELLFLDEPTTGLDVESRQALWQSVRQLVATGCSVILTTHYLEEAEALADRVAMLVRGRIAREGTLGEVRAHSTHTRIRCRSRLDAATVGAWPGVIRAGADGDFLAIDTGEPENLLRRLLAADAHLGELEVRRGGLADAFAQLTREAA
jgi:ABC-2 type transport system ATP-binding protein